MNKIAKFLNNLLPYWWSSEHVSLEDSLQYRRVWKYTVLISVFISLAPLIIMMSINYKQCQKAMQTEIINPVSWLASNAKRYLEFSLEERRCSLNCIINTMSFEELQDTEKLFVTFRNLKNALSGFVDLGVIDAHGHQCTYVGPYNLKGKNYTEQDWFHEVSIRGSYVSNVFMGYRHFPHFIIAVKKEKENGDFYMLRATIDAEILEQCVRSINLKVSSDTIVINRQGILQTSSKFYGSILEKCPVPLPPYSDTTEVIESQLQNGKRLIVGYVYIPKSPFVLMLIKAQEELMKNWWMLRSEIIGLFFFSVFLILLVILLASTHLVKRMYEADVKRAEFAHNIEYTNKLASIGRLAAGVAHEINNPLAIINEKAGLLKDIASAAEEFPQKQKILKIVDSILKSVERCSNITHRLLGFAKRIDTKTETIELEPLLKEVLSFLEKEASYRNISVNVQVQPNIPTIESDRGQLQQVFLNIVNNAFAAVKENGKIDIIVEQKVAEIVSITISDNGVGISEENLKHIFEPFFTTKKEYGTGLGLSITYGIVQKLGGYISVKSKLGEGTSFTMTLPIVAKKQ